MPSPIQRYLSVDPGLASSRRINAGDTLVVTKLDRLARCLTDARKIVEELAEAGVKLNIAGSLHDPTDPVGRLLSNGCCSTSSR